MCKGLDVFKPPVEFSKRLYPCPFSVALADTSDVYMTPGCLVHSQGVFYDPCNCAGFECGPTKPAFSRFEEACKLPFDPRNMTGDLAQLGGWRVSPMEVLDGPGFTASILSARDGLGNVKRGDDWSAAEGYLKSTGRHCDMMADWWPDGYDAPLPMGYHATTSCSSDDTGYRTFDSAFAVERTAAPGQFTVVRMVYQNDLTRQGSTLDTMAGGGGVCRSSNVGMPFIQTNRVRLCTRTQSGEDTLDPAIRPKSSIYTTPLPDASFSEERCSEDSLETVWHDTAGAQDSALHSIGTVPNMPSTSAATYPENSASFMGVGPKTRVENDLLAGKSGWGGECSDFALRECASDAHCPADHFCLTSAKICMDVDFSPDTVDRCYRHDMCPPGLMCDGEGKCVQGHITYLNNIQGPDLPSPMEAVLFSERCDEVNSNTYSTDGASPWEYVPDWLDGHGMCSNKNWYMYSLNLAGVQGCAPTCSSTACQFNSRSCSLSLNRSVWWPLLQAEPASFAVKPTVCDRDYEHLDGPTGVRMVGCTPKNTVTDNRITDVDNARDSGLTYAGLFRNFDSDGSTFLGLMPLRNVRRTGFLGLTESEVSSPNSLINCEKYQNCYAYKFTYNGLERQRTFWKNGVSTPYVDNDIFKCGVAAYYDPGASKCRLDVKAMHLYSALCTQSAAFKKCTCSFETADLVGCSPVVDRTALESTCLNILTEFTANYNTIQTNTKHLQDLFTVFSQSDGGLRAQVSGVDCFEAIHSNMQSAKYDHPVYSLYYPFTFALYEVPLAWVYQCSYIGGILITPTPTLINCQQYEDSKNISDARDGMGFNFNMVRAGYRRVDVMRSITAFAAEIQAAVPSISSIGEFREKCRVMGMTDCEMVPYCANHRGWTPNAQMEDYTRRFIAGLYHYRCVVDVRNSVLDERAQTFQQFIENNTFLSNYKPDRFMAQGRLPDIPTLLADMLKACIDERYNILMMWPFSLTFPSDPDNLTQCFRHSMPGVLNNLTAYLINVGHDNTNYDKAYMPNTNIRDQQYGRLSKTPIDPTQACIYPNLNSQESLTHAQPSTSKGQFDRDRQFNGIPCKQYPLIYMSGTQDCQYPTSKSFTSLPALMNQVWDAMSASFLARVDTTQDITPPVELTFWQMPLLLSRRRYDTTDIRGYMSNINPDTTKEVMCVIVGTKVNFTTCNDVNFAALRDFTESQRQQGASIIPPDKQLTWKVSREFLARGGIFAFANATRDRESVLLRNLFDSTRCGLEEQPYNRVCLISGQTVRPWVPWMSGEWNPYEMCDVRAMDLDHGNLEEIWPYDSTECKQCSDANGQYRKDYMFDPSGCTAKSNTYSRHVNVDKGAPTNLCKINMNDRARTCTHAQGMAGGGRGQTVLNHPRLSHLYGSNAVSDWPAQGGIFPRGDPVLRGGDSTEYGFVSIPGDELGATGVGLTIESLPGGMPYLRVSHLPLLKQEGYMKRWTSDDVSLWSIGMQDAFLAEDAAHASEQRSSGWDCPIRRTAFYGANLDTFTPAMPSPGRSRRLFGNITGNLSTHPTQSAQRGVAGIGGYVTSNGFCYCPGGMQSEQKQCLVPLSDTNHQCSLKRTVQALQGEWVQSHVFTPQSPGGGDSPCQMQFDWPYVRGKLRDGSNVTGDYTWASNPSGRRCHLVDRLRPFQYRYKSDRPAVPHSKFTTDQGGVCHTGRAATLTQQASAKMSTTRCVKRSETADSLEVSCEDGSNLTLSKEKSSPLKSMVEAVQATRMKCTQCSPPPTFVNSKGASIQAESSFGIPFRFSASRMLSAELRRLVCQNCSSEIDLLNTSTWGKDFIHTLLTDPTSLLRGSTDNMNQNDINQNDINQNNINQNNIDQNNINQNNINQNLNPPETTTWPDSEWVFCNTTEALQAGDCKGRIPEASWRKDRFQSCYKSIRDATHETPAVMSSVDVCLIDSNLQDLCIAVAKAQALVREANCLASGDASCTLKPFLYQPSAWDVSNREFVHSSVTRFYKRIAPATCPDRSSAIISNNRALANRCAATPVAAMYIALQACREITDTLADVLFYSINIVINGLRLVADRSASRPTIIAQTVYFWKKIVSELKDLLSVLSDMVFDMLFNMGAMGTKIYLFLQTSCGYLNTAYRYWMEVWCGIAIDLIPIVLGGIRSVVELCETGFGVLNDSLDAIFTSIVPSALSMMQSRGYDRTFRDKQSRDQAQQRQVINDNTKRSKKEGKKADLATMVVMTALTGAGYMQVEDAAKAIALQALSYTRVGFLVDIGQGIANAVEMHRVMSLYPQNWTLFDFGSIYVALDVFAVYVSSDEQCLTHRAAHVTEILNCTFPTLSSKDTMAGASRSGTRCWADAQRNVGTSNLLACTESDTCYRSDLDRSIPIICGSCPSADAGFSTYGCSAITKMCTCRIPVTQTSPCSSNMECAYSLSTCQLITGLDDMSYGNQPCSDCTKEVQCLMSAGSGLGKCGCMFQPQALQKCTQLPGQFVPITAPGRLCGYLPNTDRAAPLTSVQWESLAMVKCIYLKAAHIFCTQAYKDGIATPLAVGLSMASLTPSFQSRRLLVDGRMLPEGPFEVHSAESEYTLPESDEGHYLLSDDWNGTAEPCSSLAHLYQQAHRTGQVLSMGPIDTMQMHSCTYWRLVGRRAIEQYNLTSLKGRDGFLLSVDDFAAALAQRWVLVELISKPQVLLFAAGHSPLFKPLYAALLTLRSMAMSWGGQNIHFKLNFRAPLNTSFKKFKSAFNSNLNQSFNHSGDYNYYTDEPPEDESENQSKLSSKTPEDENQSNDSTYHRDHSSPQDTENEPSQNRTGRGLLQASQSVSQFDSQFDSQTDIKFAETWLAGPFSWPPPFFNSLNSQCNMATAILQIAHNLISVLAPYYYGSIVSTPDPPRGIWDNLPNLTCSTSMKPVPPANGMISTIFHAIWDLLGINPGYVREFFSSGATTNVFTISTSMLKCDFQAVTYCSAHRKDLLASIVLILLLYLILYLAAGAIGLSILGSALVMLISFVPLLLWYSYGMAFTCAPMLPTCLLDDVVYTLSALFPLQITFPVELQTSSDCLGDSSKDSCLLRCSGPPVLFTEWRDTLAFGICYISQSLCTSLAAAIGDMDMLSVKLHASAELIATATPSRINASLFCFGVTFVTIIPVILLLIVGVTVAAYLLYLPCVFAPKLVALIGQYLVYLHTSSKDD